MTIDVTDFPVMRTKCPTCPFNYNGDIEIANSVRERCITKGSQICHHPKLHGKKETHLCRGARDYQLMIFHRIGFLETATDDAWNKAVKQIKLKQL